MIKKFHTITPLLLGVFLLVGCSTYRNSSIDFIKEIQNNNPELALQNVDKNKFLSKKRNKLLYYLEKGKLAFLNNQFKESNEYFNKADYFLEDNAKSIKDRAIGFILNPEKETYLGEDFEKVAIHYYKALNYTFLYQYDDALVEAKRITLQLQKLNEHYKKDKKNRYQNDAFALNLQGLIYEASGDINNAFISYRDAIDLYLKNEGQFMGVSLPKQLQNDLFRTADILGFYNETQRYEKLLDTQYQKTVHHREVVVFWENGLIPYKTENNISLSLIPTPVGGNVQVLNDELGINLLVPFPSSKKNSLKNVDFFRIALPEYISLAPTLNKASIKANNQNYTFELAQDYETIAFKTLQDRRLRDIGKMALRVASKKAVEYKLKHSDDQLTSIAGTLFGIFSAIEEGADTRNWQTLPQNISYVRIPLKEGENKISVNIDGNNGANYTEEIVIEEKRKLIFKKISTPYVIQQ